MAIKNMKKRTLGAIWITLILCAASCYYPKSPQDDFYKGLNLEGINNIKGALAIYNSINFLPDDFSIYHVDFRARCCFMTEDLESAIEIYYKNAQEIRTHSASNKKPWRLSLLAADAYTTKDYRKLLIISDDMLKLSVRIDNEVNPCVVVNANDQAGVHADEQRIYNGRSEGYIWKYYALKKLDQLDAMEKLKCEYIAKYNTFLEKNPSKGMLRSKKRM